MEFIEVLEVKDLPKNSQKIVTVNSQKVVLFNVDGEISALGSTCLHKGGPLGDGKVEKKYDGCYVTCPWHGWEYNVKTGKAPHGFEDQQSVFEVKIEKNKIYVSSLPKIKPKRATHDDGLDDLRNLKLLTTKSSLNILGISTTNMNKDLPRYSTSDEALKIALTYAEKEYGAKTKIINLRDLNFRACEGYYSKHERACTWPCAITESDPNDGLTQVYRDLVLWADVVLVATPIRWGAASSLYYKMVERFNSIENQITLHDRVLIKNKVAGFIVTGGQDNVQQVAGSMMMFFTQLGFALPPMAFSGWSRGWTAEDTEHNTQEFKQSKYVQRSVKELTDNCVHLLKQLKAKPADDLGTPQPKRSEAD